MTFAEALLHARHHPTDPRAAITLADHALKAQEEAIAAPIVSRAAHAIRTDARLWQWSGLLHRALDDRASAGAALAHAARLAPNDISIAHGRARIALEAGLPATAMFESALHLAPLDGEILLGLAAARFAEGAADRAITDLDVMLDQHPGWIVGHQTLARMRWMMGDRQGFAASIERALAQAPRDPALWQTLLVTLLHAGQFDRTLSAIADGRAAMGNSTIFDVNFAVAQSEAGAVAAADAAFEKVGDVREISFAVRRVRHLLRTGRIEAARALVDSWIDGPEASLIWPYAALAWRMTADPRADWLEGPPGLVSVTDLADRLPPLDRLARVLGDIHLARFQHLDQSVRGGTQTDGILFARLEPEIRALRAAIITAVEAHVAALPPRDARHPTLKARRDRPVRFSGSWSVRLGGGGYHSNHVHPAGWLSSVLYIALPEPEPGAPHGGWLTLGAPQAELGLEIAPTRRIEPRPGRLVLFPSTMWHGTVPFTQGERLTVAFDVQEPITPI